VGESVEGDLFADARKHSSAPVRARSVSILSQKKSRLTDPRVDARTLLGPADSLWRPAAWVLVMRGELGKQCA
jgi:hypothetical protein